MAAITLTITLPDHEAHALAMIMASLGPEQFESAYQHWLNHWKANDIYSPQVEANMIDVMGEAVEKLPRYNLGRLNRHDGPEDGTPPDRCLTPGLPEFGGGIGSFRRIVQTPGGISIFYDVGQGQGWQRNIVMDGSPHLPASIREWYGDSRGHWEGNTLVIDVTNFSPKTDFQGARENLHLVERWTPTGPNSLAYEVTVEDPTVWTRTWTAKQEFTRQSDQENRIYTEPRCVEGNFGLPGLLHGRRVQEFAFAEGRGPDPRTQDSIKGVEFEQDPLQ